MTLRKLKLIFILWDFAMIDRYKVLAVIPARGGSKRLPRKNILGLAGKPLIAWTIEASNKSKYVDRLIISTDDKEIMSVGERYGAQIPFTRPESLASDTASTNDVILHAIELIEEEYDIVVILQPTSPLRTADDIDKALEVFLKSGVSGVISVCECEHSPLWSNTLPKNGSLENFLDSKVLGKRSQDLPKYYRLNGAIYAFSIGEYLENRGAFYDQRAFGFVMPTLRSIDIDNELDFKLAEVILNS